MRLISIKANHTIKMKQNLLLFILLISESCFAGEYSDCILENMKGVNDRFAARQVKSACREKALPYIPAKCIDMNAEKKIDDSSIAGMPYEEFRAKYLTNNELYSMCIEKCLNASYWSKHFGDCKE